MALFVQQQLLTQRQQQQQNKQERKNHNKGKGADSAGHSVSSPKGYGSTASVKNISKQITKNTKKKKTQRVPKIIRTELRNR